MARGSPGDSHFWYFLGGRMTLGSVLSWPWIFVAGRGEHRQNKAQQRGTAQHN